MAAAIAVEAPYPRTSGYPVSSSGECYADTASAYAHLRPKMIRRESDHILSYYQSEHAGRSEPSSALYDYNGDLEQLSGLKRRESSSSNKSSSEYSAESLDRHEAEAPADDGGSQSEPHSKHTRRPSVPSQESADRRRLAIVEVDHSLPPSISHKRSGQSKESNYDPGVSVSSALLSRRGVRVNGLALVAPPDASPSTYTDLTPPPTAPLIAGNRSGNIGPSSVGHHHSRSASEALGARTSSNHKPSRDIGIVGIGSARVMADATAGTVVGRSAYQDQARVDSNALQVPIFQTPTKSRSPSPAAHTPELHPDSATSFVDVNDSLQATPADSSSRGNRDQARTPAIGEEKDVQQPVVGPIIVGLDSDKFLRKTDATPSHNGITSLTSQHSSSPRSSSQYPPRPGVYATNGPLPPLPTSSSQDNLQSNEPPPRPPRTLRTPLPGGSPIPPPAPPKHDLEALKEALQLPQSVSAVLASRGTVRMEKARSDYFISEPKANGSDVDANLSEPVPGTKRTKSVHRREGAFPPSDASVTPETSPQIDLSEPDNRIRATSAPPRPTYSEAMSTEPDILEEEPDRDRIIGWRLHRENSWVSLKHEVNRASSPNGKPHVSPDRRSMSSSPSPLPPPKTGKGTGGDEVRSPIIGGSSNPFKTTLHTLKRFSALPRTPSQLSLRSAKRASIDHPSRTPSPPYASTPRIAVQRRIINPWPDAMYYNDVLAMRSTQERSAAYAQKIKDFSLYESGLRDWVIATRARKPSSRSPHSSGAQSRAIASPVMLGLGDSAPIPRHVSGSSVGSEATFPVRPDAYQATDLAMRPDDDLSSTRSPPSYLPYPSLAASPSRGANMLPSNTRTYQVPLSNGSSRSGHGFFSSIGRKASLKRERGFGLTSSSPSRVLTKRQPAVSNSTPRPIQINHSPSIPGGPRAVPGRMSRSRTISVVPAPLASEQQQPTTLIRSETYRQSFTSRRASIFHRSTTTATTQPAIAVDSPEFQRQVDKLADLLPHADRNVLAGYLRRAGQDVLAIGQYLEDEKNGTLRYD